MSGALDVDITVRQGAFETRCTFCAQDGITALFGPSGAGKTTALRTIAGLVSGAAGVVRVGGKVLLDSAQGIDVPAEKRRVGFVFQEGRLLPHLSVAANLAYGRHGGRGPSGPALQNMAERLGIGHLLERKPRTLSGGERQRLAIGRALLSDPALLLMDEPLASLDPARRVELLPMIEMVRDEIDIPIVLVSHNVSEVARLAETLVVMDGGRTLAAGSALEIFSCFETDAVLGQGEAGALVEGEVTAIDSEFGIASVDLGGAKLELTQDGFAVGQHVRLRILASDVSLAVGDASAMAGLSIRNRLSAEIQAIAPDLAGGPYAELLLGIREGSLRARVTRKSLVEMELREGQSVTAMIKAVSVERRRSVG
ncbi:molybdenum ABC transporter ATP-binding protein [Notoacmeibacter sp. MSK16QG-6]|uniref:molybdenum ABC transporter ATP-binding protein n=1 Tax=Notoacmeibacter sp. MSK16QG-6 TaxID=2957982 RepID=UPI00209ED797|nr:molybdenum ABC transporter ATP-binding protein [Notoacmeibacter sp. MSK16QG-6]MCP1200383.1 molybdenum ABC transporter ATP-binding protein [Notoacmeibacter sp. MSK16QG-6]